MVPFVYALNSLMTCEYLSEADNTSLYNKSNKVENTLASATLCVHAGAKESYLCSMILFTRLRGG